MKRRNCLLPIFIWFWLIASLVATVVFVAGIFDLPLYDKYKPDMPIPPWGPLAYSVTFFSYFVSIIAIAWERNWGFLLFVASSIAVMAIELFSGIPVEESIYILINVVVLVILLGLDEWGEISDQDLRNIHVGGLERELRNPAIALGLYNQFEENNVTHSLLILFASILSLPVAYVISYYVNQRIDQHQIVVAIAIMCLLGMGPIIFLSVRRTDERNKQQKIFPSRRSLTDSKGFDFIANIWIWGWLLFFALFADAFQFLMMALISGIIVIVLFLPYNLWLMVTAGQPFVVGYPDGLSVSAENALSIIIFMIVFTIVVSEVRLKPFSLGRILQDIPAGIQVNGERIFSTLINFSLTVVLFGFVSIQYDLLYDDIRIGIIVYAFLGALIGWDHYREKKYVKLGMLNTIGQARCLARVGKTALGRVKLERVFEETKGLPMPYQNLAEAVSIYLWDILKIDFARKKLRDGINELDEWNPPYLDLYKASLDLTSNLLY